MLPTFQALVPSKKWRLALSSRLYRNSESSQNFQLARISVKSPQPIMSATDFSTSQQYGIAAQIGKRAVGLSWKILRRKVCASKVERVARMFSRSVNAGCDPEA